MTAISESFKMPPFIPSSETGAAQSATPPEAPPVSEAVAAQSATPSHEALVSRLMLRLSIPPVHKPIVSQLFTHEFLVSTQKMRAAELKLKLREVHPLILYFDLDYTLFAARTAPNAEIDLSDSMIDEPCDGWDIGLGDSDGELELVDVLADEHTGQKTTRDYALQEGSNFRDIPMQSTLHVYSGDRFKTIDNKLPSVCFIGRKRYLKIFQSIDIINSHSKVLFGRSIIVVNLLTNAGYDEHCIKSLFLATFPHCTTIREGLFQNRNRPFDRRTGAFISKGVQMQVNHATLFQSLNGLAQNTYLLDDAHTNCVDAKHSGFKSLHIPSNPYGRLSKQSYTKGGGEAFFIELETIVATTALMHKICIPEPVLHPPAERHEIRIHNAPFAYMRVIQEDSTTEEDTTSTDGDWTTEEDSEIAVNEAL